MVALKWTDLSKVADARSEAQLPSRRHHPAGRGRWHDPVQSYRPARPYGLAGSYGAARPYGPTQPYGAVRPVSEGSISNGTPPPRSAGQGPRLTVVRDASPAVPPRRATAIASRRRRMFFWRRVLVASAIAITGAAAGVAGGWLMQVAGAEPSHAPVQHVYVARPGDTIWGIAMRYSGGGDPRPLATELEAQIGGGVLQPGDQLTVPNSGSHPLSG